MPRSGFYRNRGLRSLLCCPRPDFFKVVFSDLKECVSSLVNFKIYPVGNLSRFSFMASLTRFVSTPYIRATSLSIMTFCPLIEIIAFSMPEKAHTLNRLIDKKLDLRVKTPWDHSPVNICPSPKEHLKMYAK